MTRNANFGGARHRSVPSGRKRVTRLERDSSAAVRRNTAGMISSPTSRVSSRTLLAC